MKRLRLIIFLGVLAGLTAYAGFYFAGKAEAPSRAEGVAPELVWLKKEFQLSDAQAARICQLHEEYMGRCMQRCQMICSNAANIQQLLASTNQMTPEIEKALKDAAHLRVECQKTMLEHFYQISKTMPPEQGKRYLNWVIERTVVAGCQ